ncbi:MULTISPECIES: hypothetical protein [Haloferax]|uniref:Uncharacterized protein n=1 Tax=Haloferax marinum TaxID=2666143 RepID=A0A6A8G2Q2_9EURY|nr:MULTISPECIES: hypothetical protein [Haloferax]KAB1196448.1 hypothetical protein Hfx1150_02505 [Haloferax sp. CBA1150]MRW95444.1 hypothetical protein [Haloferax marinum]
MSDSVTRDQPDLLRTLQQLGIIVGIPVWAFLWFWPMIGQDFTSYSGIDYLLHAESAVAGFFFSGLFVGLVVVALMYNVAR